MNREEDFSLSKSWRPLVGILKERKEIDLFPFVSTFLEYFKGWPSLFLCTLPLPVLLVVAHPVN
jgi:hypothetical protein